MTRLLVSGNNGGDAAAPSAANVSFHASDRSIAVSTELCFGANVSFFDVNPACTLAVLVNETGEGCVSSVALSASLERVSSAKCIGADPCHVSISKNGKFAVVANYSDTASAGSLSVMRLTPEGGVSGPVQVIARSGSGPVAARQAGPHMHCAVFHPHDPKLLYAVDLGSDAISQFIFDEGTGILRPNPAGAIVSLPAGSGPRHLTFSACGTLAFATGELDNKLYVFQVDVVSGSGALTLVQSLPLLPRSFDASGGAFGGAVYAADLHVTPSGKFLIVSTRGYDALALFKVRGSLAVARVV